MKSIIDKKGDIPVTILVIGILGVCALAIISFIVSKKVVRSDSLGVELIEEIHSDVEKFNFYRNIGISTEESALKIDAELEGNQLVIKRENKFLDVVYRINLLD